MCPAGPNSKSSVHTILIAGLANPGTRYARTRHNAGAWFVQALCQSQGLSLRLQSTFKALMVQGTLHTLPCQFVIPQDFMNHSGQTIAPIATYYRIPPSNILIVHDELDLPPGSFRFKSAGGHAGHNGVRDLIEHLQNPAFHRLRIGIGHPGKTTDHPIDVSDYVLGVPPAIEEILIQKAIQEAMDQLPEWLSKLGDANGF